ncbi:TraB/GumN family protein [Sulfitobacter aestuariivivens]
MAAKFQPWYLSLLLSVSPCALKEMQKGGEGLDKRLMKIAEDAGVPTLSLEPFTTVFNLFARDPLEEQIALLTLGVLPDRVSENATATLKAQYFEEEHMASMEVSRVATRPMVDLPPAEFDALFDDFMDLLVRQRNENWITPIEAAEGDVIVVAAGALHLGGTHGVLNLLFQRGYTLSRQPF